MPEPRSVVGSDRRDEPRGEGGAGRVPALVCLSAEGAVGELQQSRPSSRGIDSSRVSAAGPSYVREMPSPISSRAPERTDPVSAGAVAGDGPLGCDRWSVGTTTAI